MSWRFESGVGFKKVARFWRALYKSPWHFVLQGLPRHWVSLLTCLEFIFLLSRGTVSEIMTAILQGRVFIPSFLVGTGNKSPSFSALCFDLLSARASHWLTLLFSLAALPVLSSFGVLRCLRQIKHNLLTNRSFFPWRKSKLFLSPKSAKLSLWFRCKCVSSFSFFCRKQVC